MERLVYAIGDVHGEADRLRLLHERILTDIARQGAPALVMHLGDLVDRGPDSRAALAAAIELEQSPPSGVEARSLLGNHEAMMLTACAPGASRNAFAQWNLNGGDETIRSYGGDPRGDWRDRIDPAHLDWLRGLPTLRLERACKLAFVHAGIDPHAFPECDPQVHLWTRNQRFMNSAAWPARPELEGWTVVHGHTPTDAPVPDVGPHRVNLDTGAVFGGPLSCGVFAPDEEVRFIQVYKRDLARR